MSRRVGNMFMPNRKSMSLAMVVVASTICGCGVAVKSAADDVDGAVVTDDSTDGADDKDYGAASFGIDLGRLGIDLGPPSSNPVGVFKVCNTTNDGCICKSADSCTTNGINYNTQKPPTGSKKVILFFHGHNGSSGICDSKRQNHTFQFLANMYKRGFGWICADSSDRVEKWWSVVNSSSNPDVVNLEQILAKEGYDATAQIYMIGHSNGGGFVSQMNTYTKLKNIRAVAFAHSAAAGGGGSSEVCDKSWVTPAFINGSDKDTIVPWSSLVKMFDCLQSRGVPAQLDNDAALQAPGSHHNFLDRSDLIAPFWLKY